MSKMNILIILSLFSFIFSQECILDKNCPFNQGFCMGATCECLDGYKTLFDPKFAQNEQIYCNYKQKHHLIALVLEMVLPGIGHFYVAHIWLGLIKLLLCLGAVGSSYYLFKEIKIPGYIEALKKTILNKILDSDEFKTGKDGISLEEIAQILFNITFHPFWIFYAVDVYMFFTKTYYDGYGVSLF